MRQYKDSGIEWIGRIPEEWNTSSIKHLMHLYAGATPKSDNSELWDGNIPWITPADYKTEDVYVSGGRRNITEKGLQSCATTVLPVNSIIFSKRAPIGLVALNRTPLCTNQGCIGCIANQEKANSKYYYYVLSVFTEQFELFGSGTTFKEISANNFANFKVLVPSLTDQQRIADYLDEKCGEIDLLIGLQEQMIEKLKAYKQSVITEAVTKGLNPNAKLVPSGIDWIGEIPNKWTICKMFYCVKSIGDVDHFMPESVDIGIPYVMTRDLRDKSSQILMDSCKKISENDYLKLSKKISVGKGDIIFARYATIGTVCLVDTDERMIVSYSCVIIKPKNKLNSGFLFYYLKSKTFEEDVAKYINTNIQGNIGIDSLSRASVLLPPPDEQQAIASYLGGKCSEVDNLIAVKQQKIEKLKEYKKSVIYEAVTGKTDLRDN